MKHTILEYPDCDITTPSPERFEFTQPELFLAMAHSQIRTRMTTQQAWNRVVSGYLELHSFFAAQPRFLLSPVYYQSFKDALLTHCSAKIGDAFGLILMERLGLTHFVHFEDLGLAVGRKPRPDYWFYNPKSNWAVLLECKGSTQRGLPSVFFRKTVPESANTQVLPWLPLRIGSSVASQGLSVGTLINNTRNGLLTKVVQVHPSSHSRPEQHGLFPSSMLLEYHYGRWLLALGFPNLASALLNRRLVNPSEDMNRAEQQTTRVLDVNTVVRQARLGETSVLIGLERWVFDELSKAVQISPSIRSAWLVDALGERLDSQTELRLSFDNTEQGILQLENRAVNTEVLNVATRRDGTSLLIA